MKVHAKEDKEADDRDEPERFDPSRHLRLVPDAASEFVDDQRLDERARAAQPVRSLSSGARTKPRRTNQVIVPS